MDALSPKNTNLPVLIVDDNVQYAQLLRRILESTFGFTNITAVDELDKARVLITKEPEHFKLLFIDYNFPNGDTGGNLLSDLAGANLLDGKAAFLITSEPSNKNMEQACTAGALGVVVKPFNKVDLQLKIGKGLRHLEPDESF